MKNTLFDELNKNWRAEELNAISTMLTRVRTLRRDIFELNNNGRSDYNHMSCLYWLMKVISENDGIFLQSIMHDIMANNFAFIELDFNHKTDITSAILRIINKEERMSEDACDIFINLCREIYGFLHVAGETLDAFETELQTLYSSKARWNVDLMIHLRSFASCDDIDPYNVLHEITDLNTSIIANNPLITKLKQCRALFDTKSNIVEAYINIIQACTLYMMLFDLIQEDKR